MGGLGLTPEQEPFAAQARRIADLLAGRAITNGRHATWVHTPEGLAADLTAVRSASAEAGIYDGLAGIAFFLHEAGTRLARPDLMELGAAASRQSLRLVATARRAPSPSFYAGDLGVAWVASRIGRDVDDQGLLGAAADVVHALAASRRAEAKLDALGGLAGAIPALLKLGDVASEAPDLARRYGAIIASRARWEGDRASWLPDIPAERPLTGLSHGASGIALGLASLHEWTGDPTFRETALGAMLHEDDAFDAARCNWPDFRHLTPGAELGFGCAWCHGAPGIGAARAIARRALGLGEGTLLLDEARETTMAALHAARDDLESPYQLCHGVLGVAECAQLMASTPRERVTADGGAREVARRGIRRFGDADIERMGTFHGWDTGALGLVDLSLMTGLSGVGLHMLRLAFPDVPSMLVPGSAVLEPARNGIVARAAA